MSSCSILIPCGLQYDETALDPVTLVTYNIDLMGIIDFDVFLDEQKWIYVQFNLLCLGQTQQPVNDPALPPMTDPGDQDDPYALQCFGGGYGCGPLTGPIYSYVHPQFCFSGYCSYVEYINKPWSYSENMLVSQPKCVLPISSTIPPGQLRIQIGFYNGFVQGIAVSILRLLGHILKQLILEEEFSNFTECKRRFKRISIQFHLNLLN